MKIKNPENAGYWRYEMKENEWSKHKCQKFIESSWRFTLSPLSRFPNETPFDADRTDEQKERERKEKKIAAKLIVAFANEILYFIS